MIDILVFLSAITFLIFLILPLKQRKYFAIAGWVFIVLSLILDLGFYIFEESNFLYPIMAIIGIPFVIVTAQELLKENNNVIWLSNGAALAFLIYFPFAYIPAAGDWLISVVTSNAAVLGNLFGCGFTQVDWNMFQQGVFRVEIILACTGIQAMAIMLGLAYCVPSTLKQKILAFLMIVPVIYVLNLLRNVFVVEAYTSQWFNFLPEIASNGEYGYESFFWAHNVMAELGALVFLIVLAFGLFRIMPDLAEFARNLAALYIGGFRNLRDRVCRR